MAPAGRPSGPACTSSRNTSSRVSCDRAARAARASCFFMANLLSSPAARDYSRSPAVWFDALAIIEVSWRAAFVNDFFPEQQNLLGGGILSFELAQVSFRIPPEAHSSGSLQP